MVNELWAKGVCAISADELLQVHQPDILHFIEILDPKVISHVLISPRTRAQKTYELLFAGLSKENHPQNVVTDERVREWTYGAYEGALAKDVNAERAKNGQPKWDIVSATVRVYRLRTD